MPVDLRPMDVVVVSGQWWNPAHWLIRWRGLDAAVHCFTLIDAAGNGFSPEFAGIKSRHIDAYRGRRISVHRYAGDISPDVLSFCRGYRAASKGYDFRQWFGFITGICRARWVDASDHWTCAELPYWPFQMLHRITPRDEVLPHPRLFRYHPQFTTVFEGVWYGL